MDKIDASILSSMLASDNVFQRFSEFDHWFNEIKTSVEFEVSMIDFTQMKQWSINSTGNLVHNTGRFFSIEAVDVDLNTRFNVSWDQPIINQPEIGLLGILSKDFDGVRYFLMQAKIEPGNIGLVQLSPTVQATDSNMKRVHGGQGQHYLEYFQEQGRSSIIADQLQSEQGSRFHRKRNRNVIIDVVDDVQMIDGFRWLTLREIKLLLERNNIINMDARSVLSCIPGLRMRDDGDSTPDMLALLSRQFPNIRLDDFSCEIINSIQDSSNTCVDIPGIDAWLGQLRKKYSITTQLKPLRELKDWEILDGEVRHKREPFFSVIAVNVQASSREVSGWDQPLIKDEALGLMGFITKKINGMMHFLVQARIEAGSRIGIELSPTVSCTNYQYKWDVWNDEYVFLKYFMDPQPSTVIYNSIQSEEGGRFYQFQNRNMIVQLEDFEEEDIPENFIWMSLYQIEQYQERGLCTIDTRTLLSSLLLRLA